MKSIGMGPLIVGTLLLLLLSSITVFQTNEQSPTTSDIATLAGNNIGGINTFSANGMINSLVIKENNQTVATAGSTSTSPMNNQTSYTLGGQWNLEVIDGNLTDFYAKFTMVHFDGTNRHIMSFANFRSNETNLQLPADGSTTITGLIDVMENNKIKWSNVTSQLEINKYNTISINVNNEQVEQHFNGQSVRGIVDAFMHGFMKDNPIHPKQ